MHLPLLTIKETLKFSSKLRDRHAKKGIRVTYLGIVYWVMHKFGIAHRANTIIGNDLIRGVSGGEKRRVSVAVEQGVCACTVRVRVLQKIIMLVSFSPWQFICTVCLFLVPEVLRIHAHCVNAVSVFLQGVHAYYAAFSLCVLLCDACFSFTTMPFLMHAFLLLCE